MTTYSYLKQGPMRKRPYHLLADDQQTSLCGAVKRADEGSVAVNTAPTAVNSGLVCLDCQKKAEIRDLRLMEQPI